MAGSEAMSEFVVLVPVKPPALGKSRLGGLPDEQRSALATAFARDTIAAVRRCGRVAEVMVVTDDHVFAAMVAGEGCAVLPDGVTGSLNESLVQAAAEARRRWPAYAVAAVCADLPALDPADLDLALTRVTDGPAFVADHGGSGTTVYAVPPGVAFDPHFGLDSAQAHRASGATPIDDPLPSLRLDVDDAGDLGRALVLGVGEHTALAMGRAAPDSPAP
jgi:2-phospho-L-lactate guanylyltransferase